MKASKLNRIVNDVNEDGFGYVKRLSENLDYNT